MGLTVEMNRRAVGLTKAELPAALDTGDVVHATQESSGAQDGFGHLETSELDAGRGGAEDDEEAEESGGAVRGHGRCLRRRAGS